MPLQRITDEQITTLRAIIAQTGYADVLRAIGTLFRKEIPSDAGTVDHTYWDNVVGDLKDIAMRAWHGIDKKRDNTL